jgi:hypothetical protein
VLAGSSEARRQRHGLTVAPRSRHTRRTGGGGCALGIIRTRASRGDEACGWGWAGSGSRPASSAVARLMGCAGTRGLDQSRSTQLHLRAPDHSTCRSLRRGQLLCSPGTLTTATRRRAHVRRSRLYGQWSRPNSCCAGAAPRPSGYADGRWACDLASQPLPRPMRAPTSRTLHRSGRKAARRGVRSDGGYRSDAASPRTVRS